MTKTTIVTTVLAGVLLVSGCASRCDEFCRLTYGLRQVLK